MAQHLSLVSSENCPLARRNSDLNGFPWFHLARGTSRVTRRTSLLGPFGRPRGVPRAPNGGQRAAKGSPPRGAKRVQESPQSAQGRPRDGINRVFAGDQRQKSRGRSFHKKLENESRKPPQVEAKSDTGAPKSDPSAAQGRQRAPCGGQGSQKRPGRVRGECEYRRFGILAPRVWPRARA